MALVAFSPASPNALEGEPPVPPGVGEDGPGFADGPLPPGDGALVSKTPVTPAREPSPRPSPEGRGGGIEGEPVFRASCEDRGRVQSVGPGANRPVSRERATSAALPT